MFNDFIPDILKKYFPILLFLICLVALNFATLLHFFGFSSFGGWFIGLFFGMTLIGCEMAFREIENIPYGYTDNQAWCQQIAEDQDWFKWNLIYINVFAVILNGVILFYEMPNWFINATTIAEALLCPYILFVHKYALKTHSEISQELFFNKKEYPIINKIKKS